MAFLAAAVPYIVAAGAVVGAVSAVAQADASRKAANFNKDVANQNAQIAAAQGAEQARRQRILAYQQTSSARAGYGASGVSIEGSPEDILAQSAAQGELDAQTIQYNATLRGRGYKNEATLDQSQANNASKLGYSSAAGSLLYGAAKGAYYASDNPGLTRTGSTNFSNQG
jgi:hypothetical protein